MLKAPQSSLMKDLVFNLTVYCVLGFDLEGNGI